MYILENYQENNGPLEDLKIITKIDLENIFIYFLTNTCQLSNIIHLDTKKYELFDDDWEMPSLSQYQPGRFGENLSEVILSLHE